MNMKFAAVTALGMLSLAAMAPQAAAADNGFYLGAGITDTKFNVEIVGGGSLDDNSFKVIAGFRPLDWLAVEANYIDLGSDKNNGASVDSHGVHGLGAGARGNRHRRSLRARRHGQLEIRRLSSTASAELQTTGWEPTYGAGVGVHFGSIGVRAEYEIFDASDARHATSTPSRSVSRTHFCSFDTTGRA